MTDGGSAADWSELRRLVGSRLVDVVSPLHPCLADPAGIACADAVATLANPFAIEDEPGAFHTTGWFGAFEARPGSVAVAAESVEDVVTAVRFCADRGLRVVAKGTGHDYLGRSAEPQALTVWMHPMREVAVHDAFVPRGRKRMDLGVAAVSVQAGARWLEAYQALQPHRRYVQGGGCTSVGVTGFTLGGGFGSFSRHYGTAAGNLLEAEVVTASGDVVVANAFSHPELFWALRGGGFGLGIVTRLTMQTHEPPHTLGAVAGTIRSNDAESYRKLVRRVVDMLPSLCDDHWGEQIRFLEDNVVEFSLLAASVSQDEADAVWEPLRSWITQYPEEYHSDVFVVATPFDSFWDPGVWDTLAPEMICRDQRPGHRPDLFWWATNQGEVSQYLHTYQSRWLPAHLLVESPDRVADALFEATRHWHVSLHFNKALSGAAPEALDRDRTTCLNPSLFEAAALVIAASSQQDVFPGVPGHEPDLHLAARCAERVNKAMAPIRAITPGAGSYVNETDYFEEGWQDSFWGHHYERLLGVKRQYDPDNLFRVHHGVGSE